MPIFLDKFGASVAFGIPGALMFLATVIFWSGRRKYTHVPAGESHRDPHGFLKVVRTALLSQAPGQGRGGLFVAGLGVALAIGALVLTPNLGFVIAFCSALVLVMGFGGVGAWMQLERASAVHPAEAVEGVRTVLRLLVLFALVTPFWSLFDQKASTWVLQADQMAKPEWFKSSMMQALKPALVMILIPFNNLVLYPLLSKLGLKVTALRRMGAGIAFAGLAWIVVGGLQLWIDGGHAVDITWQVLPYALLTLGEVLVSATGLEFAYSQAPLAMKGVIMAFWYLTSTFGSLWVLITNAGVRNETVIGQIASTGLSENAFLMFFFAFFAFAAAAAFSWYARTYPMQDNYRS
jgi:POT family proton-dependent oligopeptide transporter